MIDIDGDGKLTKQEFLRVSDGWSDYNNCHEGAVICSEVVTLILIAGVSPGRNSALQAGQDY